MADLWNEESEESDKKKKRIFNAEFYFICCFVPIAIVIIFIAIANAEGV